MKRPLKDMAPVHSSLSAEKQPWSLPSECEYHSACSLDFRKLFVQPKKLLLFLLPTTLTVLICVITVNAKEYVQQTLVHSTQLFQFCLLYENNYYHNLLTLPLALVIVLFIIFNQTRKEYKTEKFSIYIPLPFNPFSKLNRFDTMVLCGIVSHEILEIIEEMFLNSAQLKSLTINGPLFDLIRQFGLIVIVGLRYYPVYAVIEMSNANLLYYILCALYMWLDLALRIFEQAFCVNMSPLIRNWQTFEQFKSDFATKNERSAWLSSTAAPILLPDHDDARSGGFRHRMQKFRDRLGFKGTKVSTATTTAQVSPFPMRSMRHETISEELTFVFSI